LNSGFKTKSEEIELRRAKIIELKSQGLDQREIAQVLHVSPTTITFDLQYLRKETREHIRQYTTEQLPIQFRTFMVATQNAIKQYWNISQKTHDNKEKIQALEHYLDCHITLWTLFYGGKILEERFIIGDGFGNGSSLDHSHDKNGRRFEEGEWVYPEGKSPYVYHSDEYVRKNMINWDSSKNASVKPEAQEQEP
jgi:transcriptional regulator with XRE-family HTH domain